MASRTEMVELFHELVRVERVRHKLDQVGLLSDTDVSIVVSNASLREIKRIRDQSNHPLDTILTIRDIVRTALAS